MLMYKRHVQHTAINFSWTVKDTRWFMKNSSRFLFCGQTNLAGPYQVCHYFWTTLYLFWKPETPLYSSTIQTPAPTLLKSTKMIPDVVNSDRSFLKLHFFSHHSSVWHTPRETWWALNSVMWNINVFGLMLSSARFFLLMSGFFAIMYKKEKLNDFTFGM